MNDCGHPGEKRYVCNHLRCPEEHGGDPDDLDYAVLFDDRIYPEEPSYALVCLTCRKLPSPQDVPLDTICMSCFSTLEEEAYWESEETGVWGLPTARQGEERIGFEKCFTGQIPFEPIAFSVSLRGWIAVSANGRVINILTTGSIEALPSLTPHTIKAFEKNSSSPQKFVLRISPDERYAAMGFGKDAILWELETGRVLLNVERGKYHTDQTSYPMAFYQVDNNDVFIHANDWNMLAAYDLSKSHYLDLPSPTSDHYFQGSLHLSPAAQKIAGAGWVWGPAGIIVTWDLGRWLDGEVREHPNHFCQRHYYWEGPTLWLDDRRLAVWGFGNDDLNLVDALSIYDTQTHAIISILPGVPNGELSYIDGVLFSTSKTGCTAWDLSMKEKIGALDFEGIGSLNAQTQRVLIRDGLAISIFEILVNA